LDSSLSQVASDLGKYSYVVLGAGLESPSHPGHNNTVKILENSAMAKTTVFGYDSLASAWFFRPEISATDSEQMLNVSRSPP
jgi:hypothetical protein